MSEIYPSVRLAIRDSVTRILFDRPGQWLTTHELLNHCEEAETSDALAKILSDMAKTGRLERGLKTLNQQGREVNTWGLSPRLRDKIMADQLLAKSQDAGHDAPAPAWQIDAPQTTLASLTPPVASLGTEPPSLPAESSEDETPAPPATHPTAEDSSGVHPPYLLRAELDQARPTDRFSESRQTSLPARAPETPRGAQTIRELMWSVPEYAALKRPIDWTDEPDALPAPAFKAVPGLPPGFTLAEPDQPIETPQPSLAAATDIHLNPLPERWLPDLRLRLLGYDGRDDPEITLRVNTEGGGAYLTLSTHCKISFDPGELDFLPSVGNALCQFVDALYPYGVKPGAK